MIELKNVQRLYGPRRDKGLFSTSLTIPTGQVVGILGENGAGKSTLLRAVAGLTHLTNGQVLLDGAPTPLSGGQVAYISGEGTYLPHLTPRQYAAFLAEFFPRFDPTRCNDLLELFELDPHQPIRRMSTGERAKVEVAAGLSRRADYLLLDEPFLGKDMFTRRDFIKLLAGSLHENETLLIATHFVEEIDPLLDRAVILHKGRVALDVDLDEARTAGRTLPELLQTACGYDPHRLNRLFGLQ